MRDIRQTLLDRVTVRRYEREPIAPEVMEFIFKAIQNTPTSYNGQQFPLSTSLTRLSKRSCMPSQARNR